MIVLWRVNAESSLSDRGSSVERSIVNSSPASDA
jgi:hypothetical protein